MGPSRAGLVTMISLVLLIVVVCCPGYGRGGLVRLPESIEKQHAHGPQVEAGGLPDDLHRAYPGLDFGPLGPVIRSVSPNDATLQSLSSANDPKDTQLTFDSGNDLGPKPEYRIISVEFSRVETPFVIGIWIFFASLAKIGKSMRKNIPIFICKIFHAIWSLWYILNSEILSFRNLV